MSHVNMQICYFVTFSSLFVSSSNGNFVVNLHQPSLLSFFTSMSPLPAFAHSIFNVIIIIIFCLESDKKSMVFHAIFIITWGHHQLWHVRWPS